VTDGFHLGAALQGALPGPLPVIYRLLPEACLGIVVRQQLGLGLGRPGKLRLEHLCDALMVLLPRPFQQGLIGRFLNQGMLEEIRRVRR
jgi:hypothetical protein